MRIHTGDTVLVIAGKDKGKTGTIMRVLDDQNRVIVTGINMRTKHVKKTYQQAGQKLHYEASIHASNVMILDPKTKKPARIGFKMTEKGKKRISKISGEEVVRVKPAKTPKKETAKKTDESKATKETSAEQKSAPAGGKGKQPFWKKMAFGAEAMEGAEVDEGSRMTQDHSIPDEQKHVRKGARGS